MAPPMRESAALVMRLAALVFLSPIAIWKLQNEFLRALDAARCWAGGCARERLSRVLMPDVARSLSCVRRYGGPAMVRTSARRVRTSTAKKSVPTSTAGEPERILDGAAVVSGDLLSQPAKPRRSVRRCIAAPVWAGSIRARLPSGPAGTNNGRERTAEAHRWGAH